VADDSRHDGTSRPSGEPDPSTGPSEPAGPADPAAYPPPQQVRGTVSGGAPPLPHQQPTPHQPTPQQPHQQRPTTPGSPTTPPTPQARPLAPGRHERPSTPVRRTPTGRPNDAPHRAAGDTDDENGSARSSRRGLGRLLLLVLAAVLASSLQLPWSVLALALAVVAVVVGIRMLISSRGTARAVWNPLVIAVLALSGFVAMISGASIVAWPAQMELQACQDRALTHSARATCEARFADDLFGFLSRG
jgi:hypothetical protein